VINSGVLNLQNHISGTIDSKENTWFTINVSKNMSLTEQIKNSSKVSYCGNFFSNNKEIFKVTNFIYVRVNNDREHSLLMEIAKKNKVSVIGKYKAMNDYYLLSCNKHSTSKLFINQ